ncbi:inactive leucine-rich repeat receptor-like protein kinase [Tripterygium wilfordii]|uniref:Inactive leucine-rich repeat receptor-like protein kinase n=1 Tax=Tripterygium wilfordii TaxID=458696 RepID=A0A7J7BX99_TRIWF|nr:inactive leucine-rich repeat receptor-like protein kinase [Tripterygium wilfordii]
MNPIDTHLSTFVNGEFGDLGYVAPEYARTLVATPKGDVFSFATVLLELVTDSADADHMEELIVAREGKEQY